MHRVTAAKPDLKNLERLIEWLQSNEAYKWLPYDSWLSGGCWLLGEALLRLLPGSSLWWVMDGSKDQPQHAVVKYQGRFIDGSGIYTEDKLLDYQYEEEYVDDPYLAQQLDSTYLKVQGLRCPTHLVDELTEILREVLDGRRTASMRRTATKLTMYHGTCTGRNREILRSVLKEGLKPDPKEKAYKSPYPELDDDDDEMYYDDLDLKTETTMRLNEALGGAYLTNSIEEAKNFAQNACTEHGGLPLLVSAQIETRTPEVKIDEDFMINYVWEFVRADFKAEDEDKYYLELFRWLESDKPDWVTIAKEWIESQFPQARISEHRWNQILPAAAQMIEDVMIITFLQHYEQAAASEAYGEDGDSWDVDIGYEISDRINSFKENIGFVTEHLNEVTEPPNGGIHNIRILKPVGYRGANRILAVITWKVETGFTETGDYTQIGTVAYTRSPQDAQNLLDASRVVAKYSKWTDSRGNVYHDERVPPEQLRLPNVAHVIVAGLVYRQAADPVKDREYRDLAEDAYEQYVDFLHAHSTEDFLRHVTRPFRIEGVGLFFGVDFSKVNPNHPDLIVYIGPDTGKGPRGVHSYDTLMEESQIILRTIPVEELMVEKSWGKEKVLPGEQFEKMRDHVPRHEFVHEFIHYLDLRRRETLPKVEIKDLGKKDFRRLERRKKMTQDEKYREYLSNPSEFNAWYQASMKRVERFLDYVVEDFPETIDAHIGTKQKFIDFVMEFLPKKGEDPRRTNPWDVNLLDDKYQRKLLTRLHGFYEYYLDKIGGLPRTAQYRQAADPLMDRGYRQEALNAWEGLLEYIRDFKPNAYHGRVIIPFGRVDPRYEDLTVYLDSTRKGTRGSFGIDKSEFVVAPYVLELYAIPEYFWEYESERQPEELPFVINHRKDTFVHEFIHYLDRKRRTTPEIGEGEQKHFEKRKTDPVAYLSNPQEFNAWYQALVGKVEDTFQEDSDDPYQRTWIKEKLDSYNSFYAYVKYVNEWLGIEWDIDKLEPKWQRKLKKRLYGLWQNLRKQYLP